MQGRTLQDVYRERIFEANWALNCALKACVAQNLHNYARYLAQPSTLTPGISLHPQPYARYLFQPSTLTPNPLGIHRTRCLCVSRAPERSPFARNPCTYTCTYTPHPTP